MSINPFLNSSKQRYFVLLTMLLLLMSIGIYLLYNYWPNLLLYSQQWQRSFHQHLTRFLLQIKANPWEIGFYLIGLSFIYGIVHSAGPGHGKVIITTYLATQPSKLKKSLLLTLCSALMQGVVAVLLVSGLVIILSLSAKQLQNSEYWLEFISYMLIVLIGIFLCYKAIKKIYYAVVLQLKSSSHLVIKDIRPLTQNSPLPLQAKYQVTCEHSHDTNCGCGHRHLPTAKELAQSKSKYSDLGIILAIGMRPCSGALLVLIFSYAIGVYIWGIVATMAMSLGTAVTTSLFALLVYSARKFAERLLKNQTKKTYSNFTLIKYFIALIGGIVFIVLGLLLALGMQFDTNAVANPLFK